MMNRIFFEPGWVTVPALPDGFTEFLRAQRAAQRAQKAAAQPPAPQPGKVARAESDPNKCLGPMPNKTTTYCPATPVTRPTPPPPAPKAATKIKPVGMATGERAAGPAGYLLRLAEQPAAELEDSRSFDNLAREFWAGQHHRAVT